MTIDAVLRTYALAPDVEVDPRDGGVFLHTATSRTWVEGPGELRVIELLAGAGSSEARLHAELRRCASDCDAETVTAALLFQLDRLGLLVRGLSSGGRRLVSSVPMRPPLEAPPESTLEGVLRLSAGAFARAEGNVVFLEAPGAWARLAIHDRGLLPLLHDLAAGRSAGDLAAANAGYSEEAIVAVLSLMTWCALVNVGDNRDPAGDNGWSGHDLLFHARTRAGYRRILLGKTCPGGDAGAEPDPRAPAPGQTRLALDRPDPQRLAAEDPPFALVSERRQSVRRQGSVPLTSGQLSEFLFRTLHHERGGRRPYPSGGACYPLNAYVAVHRCGGVAPGLYSYDAILHELVIISAPGPGVERLLADAAVAANVDRPPQVLLVLAARYARTQQVYGDLSYSLILKEVGAVFQAAMMAAAAMGLGACPLGCGDSVLFSELVGENALVETSVGEMMVGSLEPRA